ncbi:class I SAM-dependent methyltransferase [Candidatus Saccharibacteria bacterium]|nr:class I SAM-dependent methyltransferase [Candidatus Saccharibacteria bacterium]
MKKPQNNIDATALNIATYNDPLTVADATVDAENYLPDIFGYPLFIQFNDSLPGKNILDLGCGPGLLSKYYSDHGFTVTGLDFSENMIKAANQLCPKCRFITKNALQLSPEKDGKFDGIVAFHLIQFFDLPQISELFQKIAASLVENGKFLLIFTNTCHQESGCNINPTGLTEYWNRHQLDDIAPIFHKSGLKIINFEQPKFPDGDQPFIFVAEPAK